ncbi:MAG: glycosyltransferase [Eubacteriales bacterium]|nr:glycosyltransferase [Eubacteriales bacterium]
MTHLTVDVIIPTCRPGSQFESLMRSLDNQTVRPESILVMNTEKKWWDAAGVDTSAFLRGRSEKGIPLRLFHLPQEEFDHGGTRDRAAGMCSAEVLLFMTQDAVPADQYLIENLLEALENTGAAAAYARQLPQPDCRYLEAYTRSFNYPEKSFVKSAKDLPKLGIKTYFCSNVCAAYRRGVYEKLGGFEKHTIFNEDMIFAAGLIKAGYSIAYAAKARVIHSHNYSGLQQFKRNFDLAVSQADHPQIFQDVPSEGEGIRLVAKSAAYVCRKGRIWLLIPLVWQSGCKYLGYLLGKNYRRLPAFAIKFCTMNKKYWKNKYF